jgi:hypothetical protein
MVKHGGLMGAVERPDAEMDDADTHIVEVVARTRDARRQIRKRVPTESSHPCPRFLTKRPTPRHPREPTTGSLANHAGRMAFN